MMLGLLKLNDARNDKQVLIGHRLFIVDDKKRNQLDKKMPCGPTTNALCLAQRS